VAVEIQVVAEVMVAEAENKINFGRLKFIIIFVS
jgi:hypothetical protein